MNQRNCALKRSQSLPRNNYSGCQKFVPIICHCEELSDEAIFWKTGEIASLRSQ
jgi:hypothetical protein